MKIKTLIEIEAVKPDGTGTEKDGTIKNPINVSLATIVFEDGTKIQLERPLTEIKIIAAYNAKVASIKTIDGISENDDISMI